MNWHNFLNTHFLWTTLTSIFAITVIDLALSGDNAAVIGLTIKNMPVDLRKKAAVIGSFGAVVLRIIFTALATLLTRLPYVNAIGGLVLAGITYKFMNHKEEEEETTKGKETDKFWGAVFAIILANLSMSFDNVMGVAGAAHGSIALVVFGLILSVPILVYGSNWIAGWMNKKPIIIYVGAAVLAHTSFVMILHDQGLHMEHILGSLMENIIPFAVSILVLVWGWYVLRKNEVAED